MVNYFFLRLPQGPVSEKTKERKKKVQHSVGFEPTIPSNILNQTITSNNESLLKAFLCAVLHSGRAQTHNSVAMGSNPDRYCFFLSISLLTIPETKLMHLGTDNIDSIPLYFQISFFFVTSASRKKNLSKPRPRLSLFRNLIRSTRFIEMKIEISIESCK